VTALATPRRVVAALFLAAAVLASVCVRCQYGWENAPASTTPDVVRVPCRPVDVGGRLECTGTADIPPGTRVVIYEPAPESSAAMVQRQIEDARRGTP
jgi:hypothetical protein